LLLLRDERDEIGGVEDLRCVAEDVLRAELDRLEIGAVDLLRVDDGLVRDEVEPTFERDRVEGVLVERVRFDEPNRLRDELRLLAVVPRVPVSDPFSDRELTFVCEAGVLVRELIAFRDLVAEVVAADRVRDKDGFEDEAALPGD
jgi:hypothetical protein